MIIYRTHEIEIPENWKRLKAKAEAGNIGTYLKSGDKFPITLKTGEEVTLVVTFDQNGKLYFVMDNCLNKPRQMNSTPTNKGGWAASDLRKIANSEIFDSLPDELQEVIVPTKIVQILDGERVECEDRLFCLSYTQIAGNTWPEMNEHEPEDSQLDIFNTERSRVKECGEYGTYPWWERSPSVNYSSYFVYCNSNGNANGNYGASGRYGVCLGFCINP